MRSLVTLVLLATAAAWGAPRPGDCPGMRHDVAGAPDPPPRLVRFRAVPYGYLQGYAAAEQAAPPPRAPRADYRAQVFHMTYCPQTPDGDRFTGLDDLIALMGHEGLKFYRSPTATMESGPAGIIGPDDVVVIKINYQWPERGGTNVDLLRGLVRRLVEHPDGFTGEIVVCENAQFASVSGFDRPENNAEDHAMSPHDVVVEFQGQGYTISHYDWGGIQSVSVGEYSEGNMTDGYVVLDYDPLLQGRVSYPKFRTSAGTYVSLRYGTWDTAAEAYDRQHLKFINVPVLKSHHSTYGVTACVKDYMGVVTGGLGTGSHGAIANGILGALLGMIQVADLNILDCIWVNANPYSGPSTTYEGATRRDELVAGVDPVAADRWAAGNILIPAFIGNGYSPPWPYPSADPDDPGSAFRNYLDNSMSYILAAGYDATNDPDQIDVFTWSGRGDLEGDGIADGIDNCPYDANPDQADCDGDGIGDVCECPGDVDGSGGVNITDFLELLAGWGPCPACSADVDCDGSVGIADFLSLLSNWGPCWSS